MSLSQLFLTDRTGRSAALLSRLKRLLLLLPLSLLFFAVGPAAAGQSPERGERIALAVYRNGQWDIYSLAPDGTDPRQLTDDPFEVSDPAYSPDGTHLAFVARRDNNWDVYVLNLVTGLETRLTDSPHYDGAPSWSPDGDSLVYESYHSGNLDIWRIDVAGQEPPVNLTGASEAGDFHPAWSPDGERIAFASWRSEQTDLFLLDPASGQITRLTQSPAAEAWPIWHPDGKQLAFVMSESGEREVYRLEVTNPPAKGGAIRPVTWLGWTDGPVWSPDGRTIASLFHRWDGERVALQKLGSEHRLPIQLTGVIAGQGRLTWHREAVSFGRPISTLIDSRIRQPYQEQISPNEAPGQEPYNLIRLNDIKAGTPWLADTVDDSFQAWRFHLRDEVGYDFLQELSDAARDVASYTDTSQYASWHKSGRAVDTLFDYYRDGELFHEIVREDYGGETYWRVLLRCVDQSGRCGRPVVNNPWNYSTRARTQLAPEQGGLEKSIPPSGYYVDLTALARQYGWQRISSYDDNEYSWTWHFLAFEYWHYQKRLYESTENGDVSHAANWYQAMQDVYPQETLETYFTWERMRRLDEDPHLIALKGVPLPLEQRWWWAVVSGQ
jgi:TolB protein